VTDRIGRYVKALNPCAIIVVVTGLVYANSMCVPFLLDDDDWIADNENVHSLWPPWRTMATPPQLCTAARPVACLTLGINFLLSRYDERGYHLGNILIHALAALALYGTVRRTLRLPGTSASLRKASTGLGMACALIWAVHPLQTESVTYIIQRMESLMGMFYLLVVYCVLRGATSLRRSRRWYVWAVCMCALGMGSKEVMVSAPIVVLIYDRIFLASSFGEVLRRRWRLYVGLAATWAILPALVLWGGKSGSAGFGMENVTAATYALTQSCVIVKAYLPLCVWPYPLIMDAGWPMVESFREAAPCVGGIVVLLLVIAVALRYCRRLGFLGLWFVLTLAPSSSFFPIADAYFEHRMYVPLAGVVVLLVVGGALFGAYVLRRFIGEDARRERMGRRAGFIAAGLVVAVFAVMTYQRNRDYRSWEVLWRDTLSKQPRNARAQINLAFSLLNRNRAEEAIWYLRKSLEIEPGDLTALGNLSVGLTMKGRLAEAEETLSAAVEQDPKSAEKRVLLADILRDRGRLRRALEQYREAQRLDPGNEIACDQGAEMLVRLDRIRRDIARHTKRVAADATDAEAQCDLAKSLAARGDVKEAVAHFRDALRVAPDHARSMSGLAWVLATTEDAKLRNGVEAVALAERARKLTGEKAETLAALAAAYAEVGRFGEAVTTAELAERRAAAAGRANLVSRIRRQIDQYARGRVYR